MASKQAKNIAIRTLAPRDHSDWMRLWTGYLQFYQAQVADAVTDETWRRFSDPSEPVHALGAFEEETLLGIVHFVLHRATWTMGHYIYLEDLFTDPAARGSGVGEALIRAVYDHADQVGAARVYWHTHETNEVARRLYGRVGHNAGFIQYRRPT